MSNIIQGVKVDGVIYKYDYESLENLPDPELPSSTASDEGKALVVNSTGEPAWKTPASGLPSFTASDSGKALVVNSTGDPAWKTPASGLPSFTASDEGKALIVNSLGEAAWSNLPPGLPTCTASDRGKTLVVDHSNGAPRWSGLSELLSISVDDEGKALVVNSAGNAVWRELIPSHNTDYDGSDQGKVLTVATNGSLTWEEGGGGGLSLPIPDGSADEGTVPMVADGNLVWRNPFPAYDSYDSGKVLAVNYNGVLEWAYPSDLSQVVDGSPEDPPNDAAK